MNTRYLDIDAFEFTLMNISMYFVRSPFVSRFVLCPIYRSHKS